MSDSLSSHRPRILAVDDTPENLMVLAAGLADEFSIQLATSGSSAIRIAKATRPDIVLLDLMMPEMDGIETCRRLRSIDNLGELPVMLISAATDPRHELEGLAAGASDFLRKPIRIDVARQRIRNLLEKAALREQLLEHRADLQKMVDERTRQIASISAALSEANRQMRAILDTAGTGILFARGGCIVESNSRLQALTGCSASELIGRPIKTIFTDMPDNLEHLLVDDRSPFVIETSATHKNGSRFLSRLIITRVDRDSPVTGMVVIVNDITLERAATEEMRKARELAESATKAQATFLANMSHEIRNPMSIVVGMTDVALQLCPQPEIRKYLGKIEAAGRRLTRILDDILDYSRLEAGALKIEHIEFEIRQLTDEAVTFLEQRTAGRGIAVTVDVATNVPTRLIGDPLRLGQILLNYASNAAKFTETGFIRIAVTLIDDDSSGHMLRLSVTDSGVGIEDNIQSKLFQRFEQGDSSTTRKYGGTGLGLAISKSLAELMGGTVGVISRSGSGSEFWFTTPAATPSTSGGRL